MHVLRQLRRGFRTNVLHFISNRATVSGSMATIEFTGLGDFETFQCDLDREGTHTL